MCRVVTLRCYVTVGIQFYHSSTIVVKILHTFTNSAITILLACTSNTSSAEPLFTPSSDNHHNSTNPSIETANLGNNSMSSMTSLAANFSLGFSLTEETTINLTPVSDAQYGLSPMKAFNSDISLPNTAEQHSESRSKSRLVCSEKEYVQLGKVESMRQCNDISVIEGSGKRLLTELSGITRNHVSRMSLFDGCYSPIISGNALFGSSRGQHQSRKSCWEKEREATSRGLAKDDSAIDEHSRLGCRATTACVTNEQNTTPSSTSGLNHGGTTDTSYSPFSNLKQATTGSHTKNCFENDISLFNNDSEIWKFNGDVTNVSDVDTFNVSDDDDTVTILLPDYLSDSDDAT